MSKHIIEFIGPPGIGKSSIYKTLCQKWNRKNNWIHQDALLAPKRPGLLHLTQWLIYNFQVLFGRKLVKSLPNEYGLRFINNHRELAAFCWHHLSDPAFFNDRALDMRFRSAYLLFADFCRYQAIWESPYQRPCIMDEGLLQKSFLIHEDEQVMRNLMHRYLSVVPLPYAIVCIDTPNKHIISQRLQSRSKKLPAHLGKNQQDLLAETAKWQHLLGMILEIVRDRQVTVCRVDGARPIKENVQLIRDFLANLP